MGTTEKKWILTLAVFGDDIAGKVTYLGRTAINLGPGEDWDLNSAIDEALDELGLVRIEVKRINFRLIHDKDKNEPEHYRP